MPRGVRHAVDPDPAARPAEDDFHDHGSSGTASTYAVVHVSGGPHYAGRDASTCSTADRRGRVPDANPDGSIGPTPPFPAVLGDQVVVTVAAQRSDRVDAASSCGTARRTRTPTASTSASAIAQRAERTRVLERASRSDRATRSASAHRRSTPSRSITSVGCVPGCAPKMRSCRSLAEWIGAPSIDEHVIAARAGRSARPACPAAPDRPRRRHRGTRSGCRGSRGRPRCRRAATSVVTTRYGHVRVPTSSRRPASPSASSRARGPTRRRPSCRRRRRCRARDCVRWAAAPRGGDAGTFGLGLRIDRHLDCLAFGPTPSIGSDVSKGYREVFGPSTYRSPGSRARAHHEARDTVRSTVSALLDADADGSSSSDCAVLLLAGHRASPSCASSSRAPISATRSRRSSTSGCAAAIEIGSVEWPTDALKTVVTGGWVPVTVRDVKVWDDCALSAEIQATIPTSSAPATRTRTARRTTSPIPTRRVEAQAAQAAARRAARSPPRSTSTR